jgi:hypothetical protein
MQWTWRKIFLNQKIQRNCCISKKIRGKSTRKKVGPFQSAMSMINFYENRGGDNISEAQKKILDKSKNELRRLFGRKEQ